MTPGTPPDAVTEAVAASPAPSGPAKVMVGAYINDIQELDFRSNSYAIDLYVWFRWKPAPDLNPTMEFMNRYASDANLRDELYDAPKPMPDGSVYAIIRYQGQFSTKFQLEKYPFDTQELLVVMEDTVAAADAQVYVADENGGVAINPDITLPGSKVGKPELRVVERAYPTNFGDLAEPEATDYSRMMLSIPVTRPIVAMSMPRHYLMMIDKVYLLAYLFIILALMRVVMTSWRGADPNSEASISRHDRIWVGMLLGAYLLANIAVAWRRLRWRGSGRHVECLTGSDTTVEGLEAMAIDTLLAGAASHGDALAAVIRHLGADGAPPQARRR